MKKFRKVVSMLVAIALCLSTFGIEPAEAKSSKKSAAVTTQKQLNKQLSAKGSTSISFSNEKIGKVKVSKGKYKKKVSFTAPKATITNSGKFSQITVADASKFVEKASKNKLVINDKKLSLSIDKASKGDTVVFNKKKANVNVAVNGSVKNLSVNKQTNLKITGKPQAKVKVTVSGKNSKINANFTGKAVVTVNAKSSLTFGKKIKGATVTIKKAVDVNITNKSGKTISIVDANKNKITLKSGETLKVVKGKAETEKNPDNDNKQDDKQDNNQNDNQNNNQDDGQNNDDQTGKNTVEMIPADLDDGKDTDNDGLSDYEENLIGSDINKEDTDGDGLTDYQEAKQLYLNALEPDTDKNGVLDIDEDFDGDGISNGDEYKYGTDPVYPDTDEDGVSDYQEKFVLSTDPLKLDTDGDTAADGWETEHGFDPLVFNESFNISEDTGEVSEANPISASVELETSNADLSSLKLEPVGVVDDSFISPSVAGYLGEGYKFSIDGEFKKAKLTMRYDVVSLGTESDTFMPRIYDYNEKKRTFEELPDQTVENGLVWANVDHCSTYILLNKIEVDKAWSRYIRYDNKNSNDGTQVNKSLDIVFVIDYSQSMDENDPNGIRKEVAKEFVSKLDPTRDRGSVVKFAAYATTLVPMSNDMEMLKNSIDQIVNNDGNSCGSDEAGTNGSDGLNSALAELEGSTADLKYIIFMTDGEDTKTSYEYSDIISRAQQAGVAIYSVGMGSCDANLLTNIAESTNGTYFYATSADEVENSEDLSLFDVMADIEKGTVSFDLDSNNDGINDYYTKLLKEGKLRLSNGSNELMGIDLNYNEDNQDPDKQDRVMSDDYDGDGIKNGDEIEIIEDEITNRVYVVMKSHPYLPDGDGDGIDDIDEIKNGTDPIKYTLDKKYVDYLLNNSYYYCESQTREFYDDIIYKIAVQADSVIFGVWDKDEIYQKILVDFFTDYNSEEMLKYYEFMQTKEENYKLLSTASSLVNKFKDGFEDTKSYADSVKTVYELMKIVKGARDLDAIDSDYYNALSKIFVNLHNISEEATKIRFESNGMEYAANIIKDTSSMKDTFKKLDDISDTLNYVMAGVDCLMDVGDTIGRTAKLNANIEVFNANMEVLERIKRFSEDSHAKNAVLYIEAAMSNSVLTGLVASYVDIVEAGTKLAVNVALDAAAEAFLPVAILKACIDIIGLITDIDADVEQQYEILCYHELSSAYVDLLKNKYLLGQKADTNSYEVSRDQSLITSRYLMYLAQSRILGEYKYYDFMEYGALLGVLLNDTDSMKQTKNSVDSKMQQIKGWADSLNLPLSDKLVKLIEDFN